MPLLDDLEKILGIDEEDFFGEPRTDDTSKEKKKKCLQGKRKKERERRGRRERERRRERGEIEKDEVKKVKKGEREEWKETEVCKHTNTYAYPGQMPFLFGFYFKSI